MKKFIEQKEPEMADAIDPMTLLAKGIKIVIGQKLGQTNASIEAVGAKLDHVTDNLDRRLDAIGTSVDEKIGTIGAHIDDKLSSFSAELSDFRKEVATSTRPLLTAQEAQAFLDELAKD